MWRLRNIGPQYLKMPGHKRKGSILYHEADVLAFAAARIVMTQRMPSPRTGPPATAKRRSRHGPRTKTP